MKTRTVLITGASSGIGKATAKLFHERGWNVVATMRDPSKETELGKLPNLVLLPLDVTKEPTIQAAVEQTLAKFGQIDVLINNAGYGIMGVFEATSQETIRKQFDTNFFGLQAMVRAVLPSMRKQRSGMIVNVSSIGGRMCMPLFSSYHASKFAVEGFTESLRYELAPLGISVRLVEPGPVKTDFGGRSLSLTDVTNWADYASYQTQAIAKIKATAEQGETAETTAKDIYRAATSSSKRLRYPSGKLAKLLVTVKPWLPDSLARLAMEKQFS